MLFILAHARGLYQAAVSVGLADHSTTTFAYEAEEDTVRRGHAAAHDIPGLLVFLEEGPLKLPKV